MNDNKVKNIKTPLKLKKLTSLLGGNKTLLIMMQDNPDPDSIAAAVGLRLLANSLAGLSCSLAHGGTVGRAENRALVRYLQLNLRSVDQVFLEKFDLIALVDTQPGAGNNSLPSDMPAHIVIDHHPYRRAAASSPFTDIRSTYGATATIITEYLQEANLEPPIPLATALLYGIRSDTQDLGEGASRHDIKAIEYLYRRVNTRMLSEIQRGRVMRRYYQMLANALKNARVFGICIMSQLGDIDIPDMIGEVADLLLRDDETSWTLCYGYFNKKMLLSLRTSQPEARADKVMRRIVSHRGTGGGHPGIAGGQIPLKTDTKTERTRLEKIVREKLLGQLGMEKQVAEKLILL